MFENKFYMFKDINSIYYSNISSKTIIFMAIKQKLILFAIFL